MPLISGFSNSAANKDTSPEYGQMGWVENIVGKGEIAHYKQFLLYT